MNHVFRVIWSTALGTWVVASESATRRGRSGGEKRRTRALVAGVGALAMFGGPTAVYAQVWTGATSSDWMTGSNWSTNVVPTGNVTINTQTPNPTVLGVAAPASATIGTLQMGSIAGTSALTIRNGSTLSSSVTTGANMMGTVAGANTTMTVTGPGSMWSTAISTILGAATNSVATLNIADRATVSMASLNLGQGGVASQAVLNLSGGSTLTSGNATMVAIGAGSSTANVSGAGSQWNVGGALQVGRGQGGSGPIGATLNVASGAVVTATGNITIGGINLSVTGTGTANVSGAGSRLSTAGVLAIGPYGQGTLTVSDGAMASANSVAITTAAASTGTVNVLSGGTLTTGALTAGPGTVQVNFDDATLRATANNTAYISGFTGTELNIGPGGLTLDTGGFNVTAASPFSGAGRLMKTGTGTAVLTGDNTYTGGTTLAGGTLQLGNGGTSGSISGDVMNNGALVFNRSDSVTFAGAISGSGSVTQAGPGTTVLSGINSYSGATTVQAGTLLVDGNQSGATGATTVLGGAALGGNGTVGGNVTLANGATLTPGDTGAAGTLTVNGNLTLDSGAALDYQFGQANRPGGPLNDLTTVKGNLALGGVLSVSVSPGGSIDPGVYRIFDYAGTLTNNGLSLGTVPAGTFSVQTSVANQVNLVNSTGLTLNFWNGAGRNGGTVHGGDGIWQNPAGNDNWTDSTGNVSGPYASGSFAVFAAAPGTVTVDNSLGNVTTPGMQFASNGYTIRGDVLTLAGASNVIRVGDGTSAGAGMIATIDAALAGAGTLQKTDLGTLVLNGDNTYGGGTQIQAGTLSISRDANLGAATGGISIANGVLRTTATMTSARDVALTGAATVSTDAGTTLTSTGSVAGTGSLAKAGAGTWLLLGADTHTGGTHVSAGTLSAGAAQVLSAASPFTIGSGATLALNGFRQTVGALTNAGTVRLDGNGTTLTVAGNYTGAGGTVRLGTALGGDSSITDRLVVQGDTAGTTTLRVSNVGGTGAQTVDGIKLVDVAGQSAGTFTLQGDYVAQGQQAVIGGAYAYTLHQNGISTPADGDWYLRSSLLATAAAPASPRYQPGVPLYEAYPQVLLAMNDLPTLHQRVGSRYWADGQPSTAAVGNAGADGAVARQGVGWARVEGRHLAVDAQRSTTGTNWDLNQLKAQAGLDALLVDSASGRLFAGIGTQYSRGRAGVHSFFGDGTIGVDGYSLSATTTWSGASGFYVDGQAQATWYDSDLTSDTLGRRLTTGNNGFGRAFSIESGQRLALNETWSLTPQAQLTYSSVSFDGFTDPFGARVNRDKADSLVGRVGVSVDRTVAWRDAPGHAARTHVYGIANLYYDFRGGTTVNVSDTLFSARQDRLWAGLGVGGAVTWNDDRFAVYGELLVRSSLEGTGSGHDYRGNVGVRVRW